LSCFGVTIRPVVPAVF